MKPDELNGHPKRLIVTLFNLATKAKPVKIRLTAEWAEDIYRKVEQETSLPSYQHFIEETGGIFDMHIAEQVRH